MRPIRVLVVDDHYVVREGLQALLNQEDDLAVVGVASTAAEAIDRLMKVACDVALLDYRLPDGTAIDVCRHIAELRLQAEVVVLSGVEEDEIAWATIAAGAKAYVLKEAGAGPLLAAIRHAARGKLNLDPSMIARALAWVARGQRRGGTRILTPALLRVLRLAVDGNTNTQIATKTGLSVNTVKTQLSHAYRSLGVRDRAEAAAALVRQKII